MRYYTGETVQLLDHVELMQGGFWIPAQVVLISETQKAIGDLHYWFDEKPDWIDGLIAVRWEDYDSVIPLFFDTTEAQDSADASILFIDTDQNDELRFIRRCENRL